MIFSRVLRCSVPPTLRLIKQNQISTYNNFLSHVHRGYTAPVLNKRLLQNIRCFASNTNISDKSDELDKVYYGILTPQIKAVKVISFTTSIGGILAQPILLNKVSTMGGSLPIIIGLCSFLGFFTFITPLLLHLVTKRYITHLDYNPKTEKYIATVLTFFCRKQQIEFSVDDVKVPDIPGMFTTFLVKGRPLFVDPSMFPDPTHYGKLMGYDKPMDFKLFETEPSVDDKKKL